jgi:hypothetical protein
MSADMKKDSTEDLIGQLCGELKETCPRCPYRRISAWVLGSILYLVSIIAYVGLRPDIADRLVDGVFLFEMGIMASILFVSALASSWLSFPDCIQRSWIKVVAVTLFYSFTLWVIAHSLEEGMGLIDSMHLGHCATEGMLMEGLPIIALIVMTMRGNTTQPYWSMAMNVLAVSSLGWIGLRLTCPMDEMGHSFFNHLLPIAIVGSGLGFFARKLFKW